MNGSHEYSTLTDRSSRWCNAIVQSADGSVWEYDESAPIGPAGGFGRVFEGRAADGTNVAVKVVSKERFSMAAMATRALRREIDIANKLFLGAPPGSPLFLIRTLGHSEDDRDIFVVMERADTSLAARLELGAMDDGEVRIVMSHMARGLDELHQNGIIHRDVKPSNVLLHDERWKLADFGISRDVDVATASATFAGWGTPSYMAPELWAGVSASPKSDLYALGCVGYEMLSGSPPFVGDRDDVGRLHREGMPPPLPDGADSVLTSLIMRLLSKDPSQRSRDARAVDERLTRVLAVDSPLLAALREAAGKHSIEKAREEASRSAAEEARCQLALARTQATTDLNEIIGDSVDLLGVELDEVAIDRAQGAYQLHSGDAALRVDVWPDPPSRDDVADTAIVYGIIGGWNRRLGQSHLALANVVYEIQDGEFGWVLYRFRAQIGLAQYGLGPMDRPHGLLRSDFDEHRRHMLGNAAHIFRTTRSALTSEVFVELFVEAMNLPGNRGQ